MPSCSLTDIDAILLAGGLGTRLRAVVSDRPKVLAAVGGKPFLEYLFAQLAAAGVRRTVLSTGHLADQIQAHFGDSARDLKIRYCEEKTPLGTGGAVRLSLPETSSDPVLVLNGDSYCDANLNAFLAFHKEKEASVSMLLTSVADTRRYGRVGIDSDSNVRGFEEKGTASGAGLINAGIYLLSRKVIEEIPQDRPCSLERDVFPAVLGKGFFGYNGSSRFFIDIGTPESYKEAERLFEEYGLKARLMTDHV